MSNISKAVTIERVTHVQHTQNSDYLDTAIVKGVPVVVRRESVRTGDLVIYFPPGIAIPPFVSNQIGVANYLRNGRIIKSINIRKQRSHGMALTGQEADGFIGLRKINLEEGSDITPYFGATATGKNKYAEQGNQIRKGKTKTLPKKQSLRQKLSQSRFLRILLIKSVTFKQETI